MRLSWKLSVNLYPSMNNLHDYLIVLLYIATFVAGYYLALQVTCVEPMCYLTN